MLQKTGYAGCGNFQQAGLHLLVDRDTIGDLRLFLEPVGGVADDQLRTWRKAIVAAVRHDNQPLVGQPGRADARKGGGHDRV